MLLIDLKQSVQAQKPLNVPELVGQNLSAVMEKRVTTRCQNRLISIVVVINTVPLN